MRARSWRLRGTAVAAMLLVGALTLSACSASPSVASDPQNTAALPKATTDQLHDAVKSAMAMAGATGAVAGVWAPWAGTWTAAEGSTAAKGGVPMTTDMHFRIGSLTKPMTCTVLLRLVDDGVVKLNDPVSKYVPRLVGLGDITLGQLCQNTSGLADYSPGLAAQMVDTPQRTWVPLELVSDPLAQDRVGAPGEKWSYSNPGFVLLGMALENATGKSWPQLYKQYVFSPLGLDQTSFPTQATTLPAAAPDSSSTALDPITAAPQCGTPVDQTSRSPSSAFTSSGVVSDLADLGTFAQAAATGALLTDSGRKAMDSWVSMGVANAPWQQYGMGLEQLGPLRGHDGQTPGFITAMLSDPTSGLTVVVMLNNSTSPGSFAQALAMELASIARHLPASTGKKAPSLVLPWSSAQAAASLDALATCPPKDTVPAVPAGQPAPKAIAPLPVG